MLTLLMILAQAVPAPPATPPDGTRLPVDTLVPFFSSEGFFGVSVDTSVHPTWTPNRVYDTRARQFIDVESMAARLAQADVVLVGEQHDDPGTHAMERVILEVVGRRRPQVVLTMEMFERDVQPALDGYLAGRLPEDSLLARARPWPRYLTDYKPMVIWARAHGWPVIAGNVPRPIASAVAHGGLAVLDTLSPDQRAWVARDIECPHNAYFDKFVETMAEHVPGESQEEKDAAMQRYFEAQCVKDETMAESIVRARKISGNNAIIIQVNGDFHSDSHLGTAARVERRLPDGDVLVVSAIPVTDIDSITVTDKDASRADYLIYTLKPGD